MGLLREDIEFQSHGATLRGWLYRSADAAPGPGVVMAHGLSAVKEMFLDRYAEMFAGVGLTTFCRKAPQSSPRVESSAPSARASQREIRSSP